MGIFIDDSKANEKAIILSSIGIRTTELKWDKKSFGVNLIMAQTGVPMITITSALIHDGKKTGVVTIDLSLKELGK